jgi:methyl-accepting chemotaxis protein
LRAGTGLSATFEHIAELVIELDGRVDQIAKTAKSEAAAASGVSETMDRVALSAEQGALGAERVVAAVGPEMSWCSRSRR